MDWKNTLWRAARTFVQAALAYVAANIAGLINAENVTKDVLAGFVVSAIAAGIAALMNLPRGEKQKVASDVAEKWVESVEDLPLAGQDEPTDEKAEGEGDNGETV